MKQYDYYDNKGGMKWWKNRKRNNKKTEHNSRSPQTDKKEEYNCQNEYARQILQ